MKNKLKPGMAVRQLLEAVKPQMVSDIESCFGDLIWHKEDDYEPNERDMHLMFDIINNGIFGNRLSNLVPKVVLREDLISAGPKKYRGMEQALAAFAPGVVDGMPTEMIMVKHLKKDNFFVIMCALIHEMIHMHDYHFGPMRRQLQKYGAICGYNLNYLPAGLENPSLGDLQIANMKAAFDVGLHPGQLPDEIQAKIKNPASDVRPRQYNFPGEADIVVDASGRPKLDSDGNIMKGSRPLPKKYEMDNLHGFYDVHGSYFKSYAETANAMGFCVRDVFSGTPDEKAMRKVFESGKGPSNEAEALYAFFDSDHKAMEYRDENNWYVEIF